MTPAQHLTPSYVFSTVAGQANSPGSADGLGSAARFYNPVGLVADSAGLVFVADLGNNTIRRITAEGEVTTFAGSDRSAGVVDGTGSNARFRAPHGMTIATNNCMYVVDHQGHTVRKITPSGEVTTLAGLADTRGSEDGVGSAARFYEPAYVCVDLSGNLYVSDHKNNTIRKITPERVVTTLAGRAGLAGGADGVGDAARFNGPCGVAVDSATNIYVADRYNRTVRKITPAGEVTTLAGVAGVAGTVDGVGSAARFADPLGLAMDSAGTLYVGETVNTIRRVTPEGVVSTIAGVAGVAGSTDGPGPSARFDGPLGLWLDRHGTLYVAENRNHTIRLGTLATGPYISLYPGITLQGSVGQRFQIEFTEAVAPPTGWSVLTNLTLEQTTVIWVDTQTDIRTYPYLMRFYRIQPTP